MSAYFRDLEQKARNYPNWVEEVKNTLSTELKVNIGRSDLEEIISTEVEAKKTLGHDGVVRIKSMDLEPSSRADDQWRKQSEFANKESEKWQKEKETMRQRGVGRHLQRI